MRALAPGLMMGGVVRENLGREARLSLTLHAHKRVTEPRVAVGSVMVAATLPGAHRVDLSTPPCGPHLSACLAGQSLAAYSVAA